MQILGISQNLQTDSVKINVEYSQIVKVNKLLTELEGLREVVSEQDSVIYYKSIESNFWQYGFKKAIQANDTLNDIVIPRFEDALRNRDNTLKKANTELKHYKGEALGLKITTPIVVVLTVVCGFLLGHYLH